MLLIINLNHLIVLYNSDIKSKHLKLETKGVTLNLTSATVQFLQWVFLKHWFQTLALIAITRRDLWNDCWAPCPRDSDSVVWVVPMNLHLQEKLRGKLRSNNFGNWEGTSSLAKSPGRVAEAKLQHSDVLMRSWSWWAAAPLPNSFLVKGSTLGEVIFGRGENARRKKEIKNWSKSRRHWWWNKVVEKAEGCMAITASAPVRASIPRVAF